MNENARDPYVGLNQYFGRKAAEAVPSWYAVGKVISTSPLKIRPTAWIWKRRTSTLQSI